MDILLTDIDLKSIIFCVLCFQLLATLFLWTNRHVDSDSKAICTIFIWILPVIGAAVCSIYLVIKKLERRKEKFRRKT